MDAAISQEVRFIAQRELFQDCLAEIKPILEEHWRELAHHQDAIRLSPNYDAYEALAKSGALRVYTVRVRSTNEIAGYAAFFVMPHLHYQSHTWAVSDLFFVRKQFRRPWWRPFSMVKPVGAGTVLFDAVEEDLRSVGASVIHCTHKTAVPMAGKMFKHRGYKLIEFGWAKPLN